STTHFCHSVRSAHYSCGSSLHSRPTDLLVSQPGATAGHCHQQLRGRECTGGRVRGHHSAEQQINGVEGMHYITSTSSNDGTSTINVTFRTGYDLNIAAVDVQNRVATAQGRLPQEIKNTGVTITKANPNFVFAAGFYSPDNSLSNQYISNYLDVYVKDALKRIPGVGH